MMYPLILDRESAMPVPSDSHRAANEMRSDTMTSEIASLLASQAGVLPPESLKFLHQILHLRLLAPSAVREFLHERSHRIAECAMPEDLGNTMAQAGLLTSYQLDRIHAGTTHGLVLGNYRVRQRLGAGGMGVVFLGEHHLMKRCAAIKVLPVDEDCPGSVRDRFYAEMRVLADLHHPNIVVAYDAGELPAEAPGMPALVYLVMELVSGGDLENYVLNHGPVSIPQACDWGRQAACGLQEAHDHHLIHRDIKPSNLLLAEGNQVKVVDFGLARQFCSRLTEPRALLGSIDFMAPEQSYDASAVGHEADIYGLGATLFWLLTGEPPYPRVRSVGAALRALQHERPRRLRELRPDAPEALEALIEQMLDRNPAKRPALPLTIMNALTPFASATVAPHVLWGPHQAAQMSDETRKITQDIGSSRRVLIASVDPSLRELIQKNLHALGCTCAVANDGESLLSVVREHVFDMVLLDLDLTGKPDGYEVCRRLRERPPQPNFKIIVFSGQGDQDTLSEALSRGADDYMPRLFVPGELEAKVHRAFYLKDDQDRTGLFAHHLLLTNRQLEQSLQARVADVRQAHDALLFAMAKMAESRDGETPEHLRRLQFYTRCLAECAAHDISWSGVVDGRFLEQLERCVPLHDIGKIGLPEEVLRKPGRLTQEQRELVKTHPLIGDRILEALGREHGYSLPFLSMARDVVRHHHERYDGFGYPDRLSGDNIPAAARLVALADVYDALRRKRSHKPALSHNEAVRVILEGPAGQFDPTLLKAFAVGERQFERIYQDISE